MCHYILFDPFMFKPLTLGLFGIECKTSSGKKYYHKALALKTKSEEKNKELLDSTADLEKFVSV